NSTCSLSARQNWAAAQLDQFYLFPETLPAAANRNPAGFSTVNDYVNSLTATARAQGRDRFFTFLTSIAEETAFFESGSNAGFGVRLSIDEAGQRVFISEAFEGAPALEAGIDRGTEILAIGTTAQNLRTVSAIIAADGTDGISAALGPSDPGVARRLRIRDAGGTREIGITKRNYDLLPVSPRYGARVIQDGNRQIGYINLRTFIETADPALESAFANFRAQGITEFVVDFRYNGGGLLSTANTMGDLLGRNRSSNDIFARTVFRASQSSNNSTRRFRSNGSSVAPTRIAFITSQGTASASELVINGFLPYLGADIALIGTDTFGKPVGQIAQDQPACDDRLRIVAFATENADGNSDYYDGLAGSVSASCQAGDDVTVQLGDPNEDSIARALDYLAGRQCTPIGGATSQSGSEADQAESLQLRRRTLLMPARPNPAQIHSPGIF
ncbi:MAG: peptidase S41, partial [Sphingomonadaceae bacterium]|nr:peptidase S41 [Sphingomonadaceae bacterium]